MPRFIVSDNGSAFTSELFKEMCKHFHIAQKFSSAFHAQTSGLVERSQGSILSVLRAFTNTRQTDWDIYLPSVLFSLNTSEAFALGFSSYYMLHGRNPVTPSDMALRDPLDIPRSVRDQLVTIIQNQEVADRLARQHFIKTQDNMKRYFDQFCNEHSLQAGDIVYMYVPRLKTPATKLKLQGKYHGPYIIVRFQTDKTVYLRRLSDNKFIRKSVNIERLKKGKLIQNVNEWDPIDDSEIEDPEDIDVDDLPASSFIPDTTADVSNRTVSQNTNISNDNNKTKNDKGPRKNKSTKNIVPNNTHTNVAMAAKTDSEPKVYHQVLKILQASYVDQKLKIKIVFQDKSYHWVPITCLNDVARKQFYDMQMKTTNVPSLRNR